MDISNARAVVVGLEPHLGWLTAHAKHALGTEQVGVNAIGTERQLGLVDHPRQTIAVERQDPARAVGLGQRPG